MRVCSLQAASGFRVFGVFRVYRVHGFIHDEAVMSYQ